MIYPTDPCFDSRKPVKTYFQGENNPISTLDIELMFVYNPQ